VAGDEGVKGLISTRLSHSVAAGLSGAAWSVVSQVLAQGFASDAKITGHQGFLIACRDSPFQLGNFFTVQRLLSSLVGSALLGKHDSRSLTRAHQGALKLSKSSHNRQH